jgi:hypothetical protein
MTEGTGHHHLLIDARDIDTGVVIPNDNQHKHFGKGQTESRGLLRLLRIQCHESLPYIRIDILLI